MPLLWDLRVKPGYNSFYQEYQQVLHQNISQEENEGLHLHRSHNIQVSWTAGENPVSAKMKKLLSIINW